MSETGSGTEVNVTSSIGRMPNVEFCRLANSAALPVIPSVPIKNQPKFEVGASNQLWTSAANCADVQVYGTVPVLTFPLTKVIALTVVEKSPPGLVQVDVLKKLLFHVASPVVAGAPLPPFTPEFEVPSPQLLRARWSEKLAEPPKNRITLSVNATEVTTEPAGMPALESTLKNNKPRRTPEVLVRPEKKLGPAPSLFPTGASKIVLSRLGTMVTTSAFAIDANPTSIERAAKVRMAESHPFETMIAINDYCSYVCCRQ